MVKQTLAAVATGAVLVAVTACAAPGSGAPSGSAETSISAAPPTLEPTPPGTTGPATSSTSATPSPSGASSTAPVPQPGGEPWPPPLVLGEILEAGTTTLQLGKVTLTLPAGFAKSSAGSYTSTWPGASAPATITVTQTPATGTASDALAAHRSWARTAAVAIPNATSAALADAVVGGVQTWGLAVVDSSGTATVATFAAAPQDFQDYLIYQSVGSVVVAA